MSKPCQIQKKPTYIGPFIILRLIDKKKKEMSFSDQLLFESVGNYVCMRIIKAP